MIMFFCLILKKKFKHFEYFIQRVNISDSDYPVDTRHIYLDI